MYLNYVWIGLKREKCSIWNETTSDKRTSEDELHIRALTSDSTSTSKESVSYAEKCNRCVVTTRAPIPRFRLTSATITESHVGQMLSILHLRWSHYTVLLSFTKKKKTVTKRFACISYELTEIEKCFVHWNRHHWNRGVSNKDKNRTKKYTKLCAKHMEVHISCMFHEPRLQRRCSIGIETPTTSSTLPGRDVHTEK